MTEAPGSDEATSKPPRRPESQDLALDLEPAPRSRTAFIVVAAALVAALVIIGGVVFVSGRNTSSYSADDKQKFMAACTAGGGEPVRGTCGCIYDQMSAKVPYDRYVALDAELQAQRAKDANAALVFPPEVDSIRVDCVARSKPAVKEPPITN